MTQKIFIEAFEVQAQIGAYDSERDRFQRVIIDIVVDVTPPNDPYTEDMGEVLCYHKVTQGIQGIIDEGHIVLVETLAHRIADLCMAHPLSFAVNVKISKPDAIENAAGVGVVITRN